jgi:hypothetical protein
VTAAGDGTGEVATRRAIAHRSEQAPRGFPLSLPGALAGLVGDADQYRAN